MNASSGDSDLWAKWRSGDAEAFDKIVRRHTPRLLSVATRLMKDGAEADEVVQEAFIAAWRGASTFDGRAQLGTWLHRIAINTALGRLRRSSKRRETSMEQAFSAGEEDGHVDPPDHSAMAAAADKDVTNTVWLAIEALEEEQRTILVLRDIEELSSKEVAVALGISDASVRQRLHRARQAVAERLRPELRGADRITCGGRLDLLFDHLDGVLADDLVAPVGAHIAGCTTCTSLASGYAATLATFRITAPVAASARSEVVARAVMVAVRALP